ncbi:phosphomannomutase/phosphoglucomutase [Patescibacteria group bacterium]|nr:phosphomannomutase/phosphoglucomutase [Patescibacteria group bacterium]
MAKVTQTMFREYDIRGHESAEEINDTSIYYIGRSLGTYLQKEDINEAVVGHDVRASSEKFSQEAIKGLNESGVNVTNIGEVTTPMGYWAQHFFKIKGGLTVTASHNPVGWNGAKVSDNLSKTLSGEEIQKLYQLIISEDFTTGHGQTKNSNIKEGYIQDLLSRSKVGKKFKILVNTGNGTAAIVAPELLRRAGCEVVEHNTNIDPTYPHYTPNPENIAMMKDTAEQTIKNKCDFGFAFDGDGDRLGMVDEKGNIILADVILILVSRLFLSQHPGEKVMFDVKVSEVLPEDIKAHGGIPVMYKTGHSLIKAEMHRQNISLTGEMSGHMFFGEKFNFYGFDDSMFAALKVLEYLSSQNKPLSAIIAELPHYDSTPIINIDAPDKTKHQIIQEITQQFKEDKLKVIDVDGARVYTDDGWGLIRASNTTPMLVLRFESKTAAGIEKLKALFKEKLSKYPQVSTQWKETA